MIKKEQKTLSQGQRKIINQAITILTNQLREPGAAYTNVGQVKDMMQCKLMNRKSEHFLVMFLDNQHGMIELEELFHGTINSSSVHPRIVLQKALEYNAAAVFVAHNHPSGLAEASISDIEITRMLKEALTLIDVRLLDHVIVAGKSVISMAERGQV